MGKILRVLLWVVGIVAVIGSVARLTVIRQWEIPDDDPILGASITPTLWPGDLVLLWRGTPARFGSLVICPDPEDSSSIVIGRVVGEEGDTIQIDGDDVIINDEEAETESACSEASFEVEDPVSGSSVELDCQIEALGGQSHKRGSRPRGHGFAQDSQRIVGEDRFFLLSDNRAFPYDSRVFGTVEADTCKETVLFRVMSADGFVDVKNRFTYIR